MKQKKHSTEDIIRILRQAEAGQAISAVCREHGRDAEPVAFLDDTHLLAEEERSDPQ